MKINLAPAIILMTMVTFSACKKETEPSTENSAPISTSTELAPYIDNFITQGRLRGYAISDDLDGITYEIKEIDEDGVAGVCYWSSNRPGHVVINQIFWVQFNSDQKEAVLFHELGHCYLSKSHNDNTLSNGNCASLMHSGTVQNCTHAYSGANKTYYLDELFGNAVFN